MCQTRVVFRLSGKTETGLHQGTFVITMLSLNKEIKFSIQEGKTTWGQLGGFCFSLHLPKSRRKIVCVCFCQCLCLCCVFSIQAGKQHGINLKLSFTCHMPKSNSKIVCVCVKNNGSSLLVLQTGEITHIILNKLKYLLHFICLPSTHYTTPSPTMIICCLDLETSCHPRGSC